MKKTSAFICVNLWLILFCFSAFAQDFKTVRDGIEYAEMTRQIDNAPVKMNLLKLDLTKVRLDVVHAMDAAIGTETTSSMATRHGAFAAINGGFFRLDKSIFAGDAAGILQIDGKLLSESQNNRIAFGIINDKDKTEVVFGHAKTDIWFIFFTDVIATPNGINRERKKNEMILYTPEFHKTTLTNSDGMDFSFTCEPCGKKNYGNSGSIEIPTNGFALSISKNSYQWISKTLKKLPLRSWANFGVRVDSIEKEKEIDFKKAEDITNGVPQLIKNGKIEITWQEEKASKSFYETKHPRTAIAKLKDGKFLMMTVDGRSEESGGIGLEDLAKVLLELGATDAMNLDGGGSTTMFLDGKVVNKPSDKEGERKVGDAILVTPRK